MTILFSELVTQKHHKYMDNGFTTNRCAMYKDNLVVDATVHTFNHTEENYKNDVAREFDHTAYALVNNLSPEGYEVDPKRFFKDQSAKELEELLFIESDIDFGVYHSTAITDYFKDGYTALEKGIELRDRNPERIEVLGSINPLADDALKEMERQVKELEVRGIKLYPVRFDDGKSLSLALDDPDVGIPLLEKAKELGVEHIGVHKAVPIGRTAFKYYGVDDIHDAAGQFPEIDFEIVHAGFSFLNETKFLLGRYPNVWANLEVTASLMVAQPRAFAKILGELLMWAGPDRIMFATGATLVHPQPLIEYFWDEFQIPLDLRDEYGYPNVTNDMKRKILSENALRFLGRDPESLKETVTNDEWARRRESMDGKPETWSSIEPTGTPPEV